MTLVTQAEYAKHHSVSRKTVTKWKDGDYLVLSNGKVDLEKTDAILREHGLGRFRGVTPAKEGNKPPPAAKAPAVKPVQPATPPREQNIERPSDGAPDDEEDLDLFIQNTDELIEDILGGRYRKANYAERVKENHIALKHILDMRERAGMLVELDKVEALFFETSRKARDKWMDWPTKIGPLMAADLGLEADVVVEVLTRYVQSHLEKLGNPSSELGGEARPAEPGISAGLDAAPADQRS